MNRIKKSIVFAIENHNMENNLLNEKIINFSYSNRIKIINDRLKSLNWHAWRDSNPQPSDPKSDALSVKLQAQELNNFFRSVI